jgi:hypothetical protein
VPEYRSLHLVSPYMEGADVKRIQRKLGIEADGEYGPATAIAVRESKRLLGFPPAKLETGASVLYQQLLFGEAKPPAGYKDRAKKVAAAQAKAAAQAAKGSAGRRKAADWLIERAGRHESGVQNRADWLDKWELENGHPRFRSGSEEGWAWCGIACWAAYKWGAGLLLDGRLRSTDWIFSASAANTARLSRVPLAQAKKGDLVLLFKRGAHVGMFAADYSGGSLSTIEGNTSPGPGGGLAAQANGGGIYKRSRNVNEVVAVVRVST